MSTMQRQIFLSVAMALSSVAKVAGQAAATTTSNPLNNFIGAAGAVASQINSANASEKAKATSSSSSTSPSTTATPTPSPSHTAAAAGSGLSEGAKIGIIIGCIIAAILILALIVCFCCCLIRRRRRSKRRTVDPGEQEGSPKPWKSPINPGRHYSNYSPAQRGQIPMEQQPTVPLMAAAATDHHVHSEKPPRLSQHPAMRQPENPFVPVPPSPRRRTEFDSHGGVTDGLIAGEGAGAGAAAMSQHRHNENSRFREDEFQAQSTHNEPYRSTALPTRNDPNRPPTPFGLTGFGTPTDQTARQDRTGSPPYSGIGQPYDEMHVHVLQTDAPSRELRHSLNKHEAGTFPATMYDDRRHPKYRNSPGYGTPPEVPSRSPNRQQRGSVFADSSYDSSLSTTTDSNNSGAIYQRQPDPYAPGQREYVQPWQQHQQRFSDAQTPRASQQMGMAPPVVPWDESEYNQNRRQSHSPRQSGQYGEGRRSSRSPATSINGQPRRLRFEDLQAADAGIGGSGRYSAVGHGQHDSFDGGYDQRWSQGVGEAL